MSVRNRDPAELQRVVGTNVFGAFATVQAFYPLLKVRQTTNPVPDRAAAC